MREEMQIANPSNPSNSQLLRPSDNSPLVPNVSPDQPLVSQGSATSELYSVCAAHSTPCKILKCAIRLSCSEQIVTTESGCQRMVHNQRSAAETRKQDSKIPEQLSVIPSLKIFIRVINRP